MAIGSGNIDVGFANRGNEITDASLKISQVAPSFQQHRPSSLIIPKTEQQTVFSESEPPVVEIPQPLSGPLILRANSEGASSAACSPLPPRLNSVAQVSSILITSSRKPLLSAVWPLKPTVTEGFIVNKQLVDNNARLSDELDQNKQQLRKALLMYVNNWVFRSTMSHLRK